MRNSKEYDELMDYLKGQLGYELRVAAYLSVPIAIMIWLMT